MTSDASATPRAALILGYAGLIPFVTLALLAAAASPAESAWASSMLLFYAAMILSFLGGCRWGLASAGMAGGPTLLSLGLSVLPPLWAWAVVGIVSPPNDLLLMALGLVVWLGADWQLARAGGTPGWWMRLRAPLTAVGGLSLLLAALT